MNNPQSPYKSHTARLSIPLKGGYDSQLIGLNEPLRASAQRLNTRVTLEDPDIGHLYYEAAE